MDFLIFVDLLYHADNVVFETEKFRFSVPV